MLKVLEESFQVISPVDGRVLLQREIADDAAIEKSLADADRAQAEWAQTPMDIRKEICRSALDYFLNRADEIGEEISWQMGRPIRYSPGEITGGFSERITSLIENAEEALADVDTPNQPGFKKFIRRDPLGIVLVLAPWNYPYLTSANCIFPALLAGNGVLLKHAPADSALCRKVCSCFRACRPSQRRIPILTYQPSAGG